MADKYQRKCQNWLIEFARWTMPRSEAPETFIFWTGLFSLSSAVRRHVQISKDWLGSWSVAPNLYILFIAPPGKARKSTTAAYADDLIDSLPDITRAPDLITKESLLTQLVKSPDSAMSINAGEFGEFIVKSGPEMFSFLTNMYDGKKRITASTLSRGVEFAERPCVNLLGATTPEWVAENMPESVIGGGFASRVVFIFEERVRRRQMYYKGLDQEALQRIHDSLVADLNHIANNINGDFELDDEAVTFMEGWYDVNAEGDDSNYRLSGYYERRPAHIHKLAMLLHLAYSDDLILNINDFQNAVKQLKLIEQKLPTVFQNLGKNPFVVDMHRILDFIIEKGSVSRREVLREFMHAAEPFRLKDWIDGLVTTGYITQEPVGNDLILTSMVRRSDRGSGNQIHVQEPEVDDLASND